MSHLLSLKFWFNLRPGILLPIYLHSLVALVVILVILTIVFGFVKSRNKKNLYNSFWSILYYFCLTNAIIGLFLLFFTYEVIPFLSARFWFLLWGVEMLVWLFFLGKRLKAIPERKKQLEEEREFRKYIP